MPVQLAYSREKPECLSAVLRLLKDVFGRIERLTVNLDHIMQMGSGRKPRTPDKRDDIAAIDPLPFLDQRLGQMPIKRLDSEPMV